MVLHAQITGSEHYCIYLASLVHIIQTTSPCRVVYLSFEVWEQVDKGVRGSFPSLSWESRGCCPCSNRSSNTSTYPSSPEKPSPLMLTFGFTAARMVARWSWQLVGQLLGRCSVMSCTEFS